MTPTKLILAIQEDKVFNLAKSVKISEDVKPRIVSVSKLLKNQVFFTLCDNGRVQSWNNELQKTKLNDVLESKVKNITAMSIF